MREYHQVTGVDLSVCVDCGECDDVCPMGCFEINDFSTCGACGMCLDVCLFDAIQVEES